MKVTVSSEWIYDQSSLFINLVHGNNMNNYEEEISFIYDESTEEFMSNIVKEFDIIVIEPSKWTILHIFIDKVLLAKRELYYALFSKYEIRNSRPEEYSIGIFNLFSTFELSDPLNTHIKSEIKKYSEIFDSEDGDRYVMDPLFDFYDALYEKHKKEIIEKIWSILFANHLFVYNFNLLISKYINKNNLNPSYFDGDYLKRKGSWPKWITNAIDFKYGNRCFYCGKDLGNQTRLLESREKHYDHIISLKERGTNDVVNLQLLCQDCNLSKSTSNIKPNQIFIKYID